MKLLDTVRPRARECGVFRLSVRALAAGLATLAVAACADAPSTATRNPSAGQAMARISFAPVFSSAARAVAALLPDFGISFDHVRVRIIRPPSEGVADTTIEFKPGQADATLDFTVSVRTDGESFQVTMDYLNGGVAVFHGNGTVKSHAADAPAPPQEIAVQYVGPGANVTRIAVSPKTSDIVAPMTLNFTLTAFDANNNAVATVPVLWTSSDPSVATISNTGTLTTIGKRGTVTVTATTPTNATDNASVIVRLGAAGLVLVSGGGQSGLVGTTLGLPAVVRLVASDGGGVPNTTVSFSAPLGGKVSSASVLTDTSGAAAVTMTLGGAIGLQNFTATAGSFSVSIPVTALVGQVAKLIFLTPPSPTGPLAPMVLKPVQVALQDAFGNQTPSTQAVTMALGANPGSATLGGTVTRNAVSGVATFNDLTIDELQAGYTLVASSAGAPNITSALFNVTAGLISIVPASIDAVFATVPFTLNGTGFLPAGTTVALTGNLVSANAVVQNGILINGNLVVVGGGATSVAQITATTLPFGVSNPLSLEVGAVGGATLQVGPPEGGSGGNPYTIDCPAGTVATGLNVRAAVNVDNVQLICQPVTGVARIFGQATTTAAVGGAGGIPATLSCPVGMVLVGLKGFLGSGGTAVNDAIQGLCQSTAGGVVLPTAIAGQESPGSTSYQATCPTGLALTGIQGGAGDLVDRTQIRCR